MVVIIKCLGGYVVTKNTENQLFWKKEENEQQVNLRKNK